MYRNDYAGAIEKWKVDLIVSRAKRLGLRRQDLDLFNTGEPGETDERGGDGGAGGPGGGGDEAR